MSREKILELKNKVAKLEQQLSQAKDDLEDTTRAEAVARPEGWLVLADEYPYSSQQRVKMFPLTSAGAYAPPGFQGGVADIETVGIEPTGHALVVGKNYDEEAVSFSFKPGEDGHLYAVFAFFTTDRKVAEAWQRAEAEKIKKKHPDVTVLMLEEGKPNDET